MTTDIIAQAEAVTSRLGFLSSPFAETLADGARLTALCLWGHEATDVIPALIARVRELEKSCAELAELYQRNYQRADSAEATVATLTARVRELEGGRQKLEIDLATVLAREANSFTRHDAKMQAAEATVATLTAQVEAMRGAGDALAERAELVATDAAFTQRDIHDSAKNLFPLVRAWRAALTTENQTNG
jgi:phage shock protein A